MKKLIFAIVLLACTGCGTTELREQKSGFSRFVIVEDTGIYLTVYDRRTKVMYAVSRGEYNKGTFTLLVDTDGKPLLWEGTTE